MVDIIIIEEDSRKLFHIRRELDWDNIGIKKYESKDKIIFGIDSGELQRVEIDFKVASEYIHGLIVTGKQIGRAHV